MATPKVYADFHNLDDFNRLRLTCAGTIADLARQGIELRNGLVLTLFMDDADDQGQSDELLAEGIVHYDPHEKIWVASIDWDTVRHASDERNQRLSGSSSINGAQPQDTRATKSQN
ncbi:MAG TPA: hypothetical protein VMG10_24860 [Gemmataceae bacterium]|nr:hypothetical protein [Gemmataceae bacterium]